MILLTLLVSIHLDACGDLQAAQPRALGGQGCEPGVLLNLNVVSAAGVCRKHGRPRPLPSAPAVPWFPGKRGEEGPGHVNPALGSYDSLLCLPLKKKHSNLFLAVLGLCGCEQAFSQSP